MNYWLYTLSKKEDANRYFEWKDGEKLPATTQDFIKHIEKGSFPETDWWSIKNLYDDIEVGDKVFINGSGKGIIGFAEVIDKDDEFKSVNLKFDLNVCMKLIKNPVVFGKISKFLVNKPRILTSVVKLEKECLKALEQKESIDHNHYAKKALEHLINRVKNTQLKNKKITYGDLAREIQYPNKPYVGDSFGRNISSTLCEMGHLLDNLSAPDWQGDIPKIQAIVVNKNEGVPGKGFEEFSLGYKGLTKEEKKKSADIEEGKVINFGDRWDWVLEKLNIIKGKKNKPDKKPRGRYNPYGGEGSPEHRKLRDYIAKNPETIGIMNVIRSQIEYPLKSGDKVDVYLELDDEIVVVEVKPIRSAESEFQRGLFQCIKYKAVIEAELKCDEKTKTVRTILVIEDDMPGSFIKVANKLTVVWKKHKIN